MAVGANTPPTHQLRKHIRKTPKTSYENDHTMFCALFFFENLHKLYSSTFPKKGIEFFVRDSPRIEVYDSVKDTNK